MSRGPVANAMKVLQAYIFVNACQFLRALMAIVKLGQWYSTSLQSKTLEDVGSNPDGCGAFSSLSYQQYILNSGPSRRCNTTDFPILKNA